MLTPSIHKKWFHFSLPSVQHLTMVSLGLVLGICGCKTSPDLETPSPSAVPSWAQDAVWYQIFVERFRNGDLSNDPTPLDMEGADPPHPPGDWSVTPWGHDWYQREPWQENTGVRGFHYRIQFRRYGGDLQGVRNKLDYLASLGINAIYFNPLNDAPSLHKYDARNWRHIDRNFGPDPQGDAALMAAEIPDQPATWKWTAADQLFLKIIQDCHQRGIRVIMDYSWNHVGREFWAIKDLRENGPGSSYIDWFNVHGFDDPATEADEFDYEGWAGLRYMPVVKKTIAPAQSNSLLEGNLHSKTLKQHIFNVTSRWLDPNGDGNPSDGVDGFRLDVAAEVPSGFWRDYRAHVRSINAEAYLVGEVWWEKWPDQLKDPRPYLGGDQFDAIMNYRWYRLARRLFGHPVDPVTPSEFAQDMEALNAGIPKGSLYGMMNLVASHDSPRVSTSLLNTNPYKSGTKPNRNNDYLVNQPDDNTRQSQMMLLLHQFTFIGAPHIWYGDEVGMWGADDPDCRKPMVWEDIVYQDERSHLVPTRTRPVNRVAPDMALLGFYRNLCRMRRNHPVLNRGDLKFIHADDTTLTLGYSRVWEEDEVVVIFNLSEEKRDLILPVRLGGRYTHWLEKSDFKDASSKQIKLTLAPRSGAVYLKK